MSFIPNFFYCLVENKVLSEQIWTLICKPNGQCGFTEIHPPALLAMKACTIMLFCCFLWFVYILKRLPFFSACGLTCGSQRTTLWSLFCCFPIGSRCLILVLGLHALRFTHWAIFGLTTSTCLFIRSYSQHIWD